MRSSFRHKVVEVANEYFSEKPGTHLIHTSELLPKNYIPWFIWTALNSRRQRIALQNLQSCASKRVSDSVSGVFLGIEKVEEVQTEMLVRVNVAENRFHCQKEDKSAPLAFPMSFFPTGGFRFAPE